MNANIAWRAPQWRSVVWAGVVGSLVTWTWAWYVGRGAQAVMILFALAAVAFAFRATAGMRVALVGLMLIGFVMFLAAIYWMFWVMMPTGPASAVDTASLSLFPMVASVVLLVGAAAGFRHTTQEDVPAA
jgi:hypothetical protein